MNGMSKVNIDYRIYNHDKLYFSHNHLDNLNNFAI
jgi:hypothetical protein